MTRTKPRTRTRWRSLQTLGAGVLLGLVGGYLLPRPEPPPAPQPAVEASAVHDPIQIITERTYTVLRVIDGDTLQISYDGEPTSVRLYGIDAPERRDPKGPAATAALRELVEGKTITIDFPGDRKRDSFGRLLCRVYADGVDVGAELLERGLVDVYRR